MALSRTVSDTNGDFSRKSQIFPTPVYFAHPLKGFPWVLGNRAGAKKLEWWGYRAEKEVWRYLQPSGYNTQTWRTDGRTPGDSKDRAYAQRCTVKMRIGERSSCEVAWSVTNLLLSLSSGTAMPVAWSGAGLADPLLPTQKYAATKRQTMRWR